MRALSALPAAGGCFCAALVLAVVADSDPGAVYEQHRWLGAVVAASAVCAYVAMMQWATLRHGGLPAPVLLIALVLSGVPFLLPGGLFLPAAAIAVARCAALPTAGLAFGGFDPWRKGYVRTVSHAAEAVSVDVAGTGATVALTLRAADRGACGKTVERRFAVTWRLARTEAGWRATAASARKLSGPEPC